MAAITTVTNTPLVLGSAFLLRTGTAQANTGQTDWIDVPNGATCASFFFNLTALAGTTRIATPAFRVADPIARDDSFAMNVGEHAALTGITAVNQYVFDIGGGITGIANDVTNSATADSYVQINAVLPALLGVTLTLDRADGDETYTYTLTGVFR